MALTLMKGSEAIAEAAIRAGCRYFFGYPITPQTEIPEYMSERMPEIGGCFLQAESEVGAINMVYGAAGTGERVLTSSSSPGVSLKQEGISYIAGAQLPCVIMNVMRGGPGLGSIQAGQGDYFQATKGGGHGDYHLVVFAPASVQESIDLMSVAFDTADKYQCPVMIVADGMICQMMEPVVLPDNSGKQLPEKPWAASGHRSERKHNVINSLYLTPQALEKLVVERYQRYEIVKQNEQRAEEYLVDDADVVVVAYGASSRVSRSAVNMARKEGIKVGLVRPITLWPFPVDAVEKAVGNAKEFLCVEMSMGQMVDDVRLVVNGRRPVHFYGRTGGMIPTPAEVLEQIRKIAGGVK